MGPLQLGLAIAASMFPGLTLNAQQELREFVKAQMRGRHGAVIVSNPATGEIQAEWNPATAYRQALPPGSTAKLVAAAVALENGILAPQDRISCQRVPESLGEPFRCTHPTPIEPFTVATALAHSCNYFFAALSSRLDASAIRHGYAMFGFTGAGEGEQPSGGRLHIAGEPAAKARAVLGERPVLVTPAQLLLAYSAIATRGTVFELRKATRSKTTPAVARRVALQASTWMTLAAGLEECVDAGTGQAAAVPGVRVAGKTGTAGAVDGSGKTHAWFVGFAPAESAEIALVVVLDRGTGARDAAPLAGRILRRYFDGKDVK